MQVHKSCTGVGGKSVHINLLHNELINEYIF